MMAKDYTAEDLYKNDKIYANRIRTGVLEQFYEQYLSKNVYIFKLSNGDEIQLVFNLDQFCHLLGFQYFNYSGIRGWNELSKSNIVLTDLPTFAKHKREEIRMVNFPKILRILEDPAVYVYENKDMRYASNYFAIWSDGVRYYKLGIIKGKHGVYYGETYQVSLITSKDNKEICKENLLQVVEKKVIPTCVYYSEKKR